MKTVVLERFESVNLYYICETQYVTELDSPAIGTTFTIAKRQSLYEFFSSRKEAQEYIRRLRKEYMSKNPTLKLISRRSFIDPRRRIFALEGKVNHDYSHVFEIRHFIDCKTMPLSMLPENIEDFLNNPRRRIVEDRRDPTPFPAYLEMPKPDFSKIVLF